MTIYMYIAACAWITMCGGYFLRRNRRLHPMLMRLAILIDFGLVLYLEATRGAVETALEFKLAVLKQIHIGFSTVALVLYFPVLYFGFHLLKGPVTAQLRNRHIKFALAAFFFRTLGFIFMFSMWKV